MGIDRLHNGHKRAQPLVSLSDEPACNRRFGEDAFVISGSSLAPFADSFRGMPFNTRLECISRRFLGIPYKEEPLGEGFGIDPDPTFRFDALDCMTFVEETIALANAKNADSFLQELDKIRYRGGDIEYSSRNHFVEADWFPNNQAQGFIGDITSFVGENKTRQTLSRVDRIKWLFQKSGFDETQKLAAIEAFERAGISGTEEAILDYIPIRSFFTFTKNATIPDEGMIARMPEISVVLMLRREEDAPEAGTIVAHMGLVITPLFENGSRGNPVIRHSSGKKRVFVDEPFTDYLLSQEARLEGVRLLEITERHSPRASRQLP